MYFVLFLQGDKHLCDLENDYQTSDVALRKVSETLILADTLSCFLEAILRFATQDAASMYQVISKGPFLFIVLCTSARSVKLSVLEKLPRALAFTSWPLDSFAWCSGFERERSAGEGREGD